MKEELEPPSGEFGDFFGIILLKSEWRMYGKTANLGQE